MREDLSLLLRKKTGLVRTQWGDLFFVEDFEGAYPSDDGKNVVLIYDGGKVLLAEMGNEREARDLASHLRWIQVIEGTSVLPVLDVPEAIEECFYRT